MNKLVRNGKVAVLVSPGYGAGWSTWNGEQPELLYDPDIASAVEDGNLNEARALAEAKYPDAYLGGLDDLRVEWVPEGTPFRIDEYDGSETITYGEDLIHVA